MTQFNSIPLKKDYDIMIVGGGLAGISTLLHPHKLAPELASRTILIEKEKYPRDKLCGGAISGWSEIIFKNLGVNVNVPSVWIDNVEFRYGDDVDSIHQSKFFRVVQRREFDHELANISIKRRLTLQDGEELLDFVRSKIELLDGSELTSEVSKRARVILQKLQLEDIVPTTCGGLVISKGHSSNHY